MYFSDHHRPRSGAIARTDFFVLYSVFKERLGPVGQMLVSDAVTTVGPTLRHRWAVAAGWGELSTYSHFPLVSNTCGLIW